MSEISKKKNQKFFLRIEKKVLLKILFQIFIFVNTVRRFFVDVGLGRVASLKQFKSKNWQKKFENLLVKKN
jgi:hypothetical protein